MSFKRLFSRSLGAAPGRLHAAAHSHHLWPDAAFEGHAEAAADAARLADRKWDRVFEEIMPAARAEIAGELGLPDAASLAFAPNTHDLIVRLRSCFPYGRPIRVLTTDSEFHSAARQLARWEEAGLATAERTSVEPFATFPERLLSAIEASRYDWVFLSQVFFGSGRVFEHADRLADALADREEWLILDGYHGFMAVPTDLSGLAARAFYLAGGYKYAMAGEGVCFLHAPPGFGSRPTDTGWFAAFEALETGAAGVPYATSGSRFLGATFDPSGLYRFLAVRRMLATEGLTTAWIDARVRALQDRFVGLVGEGAAGTLGDADLLAPLTDGPRARLLAFRHADASSWTRALGEAGAVVDVRGDVLRIGFGLYHDAGDVDRLAALCRDACA